MKLCCSMLFISGVNVVMLSMLFVYGVDVVMFDLEDVVLLCEKDIVCLLVYQVLQYLLYQDIEIVVCINLLNMLFGFVDFEVVVCVGVDMVCLLKIDSKEDIYELEVYVEWIECECGWEVGSIKLMVVIELVLGVVNVVEIVCVSLCLVVIVLVVFDYVMDMGIFCGDGIELFYVCCVVLYVVCVVGIVVYDVVWLDINNEEGFLVEVNLVKNFGFNGKLLVNL